jgi:tetratricopeptide (TPR) repeat protein
LEDSKKNVITQKPVYQFCVKGKMLFDLLQTEKALKEFKDIEGIIKTFDSYIVLSVANIYYEWSTRLRDQEPKQSEFLQRANEKYKQVLEYDESNIFAAMGIACVFAEFNKVEEAVEILKKLMEASPAHMQRPSVLINLAHLKIVMKNYETAINLYTKSLEKFPAGHGDLETELYLAKAYFMNEQFEQALKRLKDLAHRYPNDLRVKFDIAICLYE